MSKIPRDPSWCSYCRTEDQPCQDHRGPDGSAAEYRGHDAYDPSAWVLEVVGAFYSSGNFLKSEVEPWDLSLFICDGYDPRHGFWMKDLRTGKCRNVSERAIGRTFHVIRSYNPNYREAASLLHLSSP